MQFLNPLGLLLLGLIPILLLIHSLKPKAKEVSVTTFFLWNEALQEQPSGFRINKLLKNLPLILQILIILLSTLALIQPIWLWNSQQYGNMIIVLDSSASMKTRNEGQIRFDAARQKALELIDKLPLLSKALIIDAGTPPQVKIHFSDDKQKLYSAIYDIQPTDTGGDLENAKFLALSFFSAARDDQIFIITDGAGGEIEKITGIHKNITPLLVRGGEQNIGITKFEIRKELQGQDNYQILLEVKNFNPTSAKVHIRLRINNSSISNPTVSLNAGEKKLLFFPYSGFFSGIAEARLTSNDDFMIDNQAHAVLKPARTIKVLLVTQGNFYLERMLEAYPNFDLEITDKVPQPWRTKTVKKDIVIMDRIKPPSTISGNFLLIDAYSSNIPLSTEKSFLPTSLNGDKNHPIMANIDLNGINVESATETKAEAGVKAIVESEEAGLIYTYEKEQLRAVQFTFDLTRSDLPMKVAFPILMNNIFRWLHPNKFEPTTENTTSGSSYPLHLKNNAQEITVQTPSGKKERHQPVSSPYYFENTKEVGIYLVSQGKNKQFFAVNLLNERESDIQVPEGFKNTDSEGALNLIADSAIVEHHLWSLLFFVAASFLALEWYFWVKPSWKQSI
ncbi:MAG: VWA domain-containing protein [SAR324 cluster bacterium]|nr:VWA domain-containing protein [SAR324 cluster bacterium]